jgi:hypothetical protein
MALRHRAKLMDPWQLSPGKLKPPVSSSGGYQDLLILDLLARVQDHVVRGGIHGDNARLDEQFDIVLRIPVGRSDIPAVEILLRTEVGLG